MSAGDTRMELVALVLLVASCAHAHQAAALSQIDAANSTQACAAAPERLPLDSVSGIAADAGGRLLVAGQRGGAGVVLSLYAPLTAAPPDETPSSRSQASGLHLLAGRPSFVHAVTGGWLVGGGAGGTGFVSRLDQNGATQWTYRVSDSADSYFRDATPDRAGGFWAIGQFAGSAAGYASRGGAGSGK